MPEPPSSNSSAVDGSDRTVRREFGRLRSTLTPDKVALSAGAEAEPAEQDADNQIGPVDFSAKAFVGPNGTYYDDRWRWMDWRGRRQSWNWAAASSFGAWFAYRRMYRYATIYGLWLMLLLVMAFSGTPLRLVALLQLGVSIGLGLYGNTLYQQHFYQNAKEIVRLHSSHAERMRALTTAGGTGRRGLFAWAGAVVAVGVLLLLVAPSFGLEARWTY